MPRMLALVTRKHIARLPNAHQSQHAQCAVITALTHVHCLGDPLAHGQHGAA